MIVAIDGSERHDRDDAGSVDVSDGDQSGWRDVMQREVDAYSSMRADAGPLRPGGGGQRGGGVKAVHGPDGQPVNSWTHVAMTYDGARCGCMSTARRWRARPRGRDRRPNGAADRRQQPYGEYFTGLIDEVRVYNRALTQPEIQADMATAVGAGGGC